MQFPHKLCSGHPGEAPPIYSFQSPIQHSSNPTQQRADWSAENSCGLTSSWWVCNRKWLSFIWSPVDCVMGEWSNWSACCGGEITSRSREVIQDPLRSGDPCSDIEQRKVCSTGQPCPSGLRWMQLLCWLYRKNKLEPPIVRLKAMTSSPQFLYGKNEIVFMQKTVQWNVFD